MLSAIMMENLFVISLICLVSGILCTGGMYSNCTHEMVRNCTQGLDVLGRDIVPNYNEEDLERVCSDWTMSMPCLLALEFACKVQEENTEESGIDEKAVRMEIQEFSDGYGFLCDVDNKQIYQTSVQDCMDTDENRADMKTASENCYETHHNHTWWLNSSLAINIYKYCGAAKEFLTCQKKLGKDMCEDVAVQTWIWDYHSALWSAHMASVECSTSSKMEAGAIAIVAICGFGAFWAILFVAISFISAGVAKKKNKPSANGGPKPANGSLKSTDSIDVTEASADSISTLPPAPEHGILKKRK